MLGLVCIQGKPVPVAGDEIQNLMQGIVDGTAVYPHPYLKAGCKVRVRSGVLAGLEGILVRRRDGARVVLQSLYCSAQSPVNIEEADVEPVN